MRLIVLIILMNFVTINSMAEDIRIPFSSENAKHWGYISDRTMGGISDGQAFLDQDKDTVFARLMGNVSTKNN